MIEMLLCNFAIDTAAIRDEFGVEPKPSQRSTSQRRGVSRHDQHHPDGFEITEEGRPLARMIARAFDGYEMRAEGHSAAF
jgi:oxygen-independent coproporphyrinogen-3 oxidase